MAGNVVLFSRDRWATSRRSLNGLSVMERGVYFTALCLLCDNSGSGAYRGCLRVGNAPMTVDELGVECGMPRPSRCGVVVEALVKRWGLFDRVRIQGRTYIRVARHGENQDRFRKRSAVGEVVQNVTGNEQEPNRNRTGNEQETNRNDTRMKRGMVDSKGVTEWNSRSGPTRSVTVGSTTVEPTLNRSVPLYADAGARHPESVGSVLSQLHREAELGLDGKPSPMGLQRIETRIVSVTGDAKSAASWHRYALRFSQSGELFLEFLGVVFDFEERLRTGRGGPMENRGAVLTSDLKALAGRLGVGV